MNDYEEDILNQPADMRQALAFYKENKCAERLSNLASLFVFTVLSRLSLPKEVLVLLNFFVVPYGILVSISSFITRQPLLP